MGRNGLTEPEVHQFRRAVFAACADRQYPELFGDDGFADRPDVDEVAREIRLSRGGGSPWEQDAVSLVARVKDLEGLLLQHEGQATIGAQRRRQEAALLHLYASLINRHGIALRCGEASRLSGLAADLGEEWFGGNGLGLNTRPLDLRVYSKRMQLEDVHSLTGDARVRGYRRCSRRKAALARECEEAGCYYSAYELMGQALGCSFVLSERECEPLIRETRRLFECLDFDNATPLGVADVRYYLLHAEVVAGQFGEAERQLEGMAPMLEDSPYYRAAWHASAGDLKRACGSLAEAGRFYEQGLQIAQRGATMMWVRQISGKLADVRQAQEASPRRAAGRSASSRMKRTRQRRRKSQDRE
jgi:hypothetical protein